MILKRRTGQWGSVTCKKCKDIVSAACCSIRSLSRTSERGGVALAGRPPPSRQREEAGCDEIYSIMTGVHNLHMDDAGRHTCAHARAQYSVRSIPIWQWTSVSVGRSPRHKSRQGRAEAEWKRAVRCHKPGCQMTKVKARSSTTRT
jgi:hypothetical protein